MQSLASLEQVIQTLVLANFQQNVHIFSVFKKVLELAHVLVLQTAMNFYFAHELLLGAGLGQRCLLHYLARIVYVISCEFVTLSETTFAQKFALVVLADFHAAVGLLDLFFDDARRRLLTVH